MYYNTIKFGNELRNLRKKMNITQKDVFTLTSINENTQRKIENGKVIPKQETLDLLSIALKRDVTQLFLSCRIDLSSEYEALLIQLETVFESSDMEKLINYKKQALELLNTNMNHYYKQLLKQLILFMDGCISSNIEGNYERASEQYLDAMRMTNPKFSLSNFKDSFYSKLELRILMNIGINENERHRFDSALRILEHCVLIAKSDEEFSTGYLTAKIYYNTSYLHHLNNQNEEALFYAQSGIAYNIKNRSQFAMGALYIRKGFAEYYLSHTTYEESFKTGLIFFELSGQKKLHDLTLKILTERHGISLI